MNKDLILENLIALLKYGRSKRKGSIYQLRNNKLTDIADPVFFLSTGRTGTKWFANFLGHDKKLLVFHAPKPDLSVQSTFAYKELKKSNFKPEVSIEKALQEIFLAAREENLRYSYKTQKRYIETNNYITFFAPVIAKLFPDSKFVHLYRHPGDFVRSGLNRNYYSENDVDILRRISSGKTDWENYEVIQKISWLWSETNNFIEEFKSTISKERVYSFKFENLNVEELSRLFDFLNIDFSLKKLKKEINVKANVQKNIKVDSFNKWDNEMKNKVLQFASDLMVKYNYSFN